MRTVAAIIAACALAGCSSSISNYIAPPSPPPNPFATFSIPNGAAGPNAMTLGPSGAMWFVTSGNAAALSAVGSMTASGKATIYFGGKHPGLHADAIGFFGIAPGPDGNLWFSEPLNAKVVRITPSGTVTETNAGGALPFKVTPGPQHAMWYALNGSSAIGRVTTAPVPSATAYPIPSPRPAATANVQAVVNAPDGYLYFTDCGASGKGLDGIGQVVASIASVRMHEIAVPTQHSCPQGIVAGHDGSLWFLESNVATGIYNVARIVPAKPFAHSRIDEFPMPVAAGKLAFLTEMPDGTLWTANNGTLPGSIAHVTHLPPLTSRRRPDVAIVSVGQQPIPIGNGPSASVWFGEPAVSELVEYRP